MFVWGVLQLTAIILCLALIDESFFFNGDVICFSEVWTEFTDRISELHAAVI